MKIFPLFYSFEFLFVFALELKALATSSVNLKRLMNETINKEPILIIVSPGSDPTQVSFFFVVLFYVLCFYYLLFLACSYV